jgi:transcription-repair coupling factor (superfamily II helicase)
MREALEELLPEARIVIGHGQLPERELERVMRDFTTQKANLLLCTTIIETGINIPTANTIIINRADRFGLAQLHQLRGRVGRSTTRPTPTCSPTPTPSPPPRPRSAWRRSR